MFTPAHWRSDHVADDSTKTLTTNDADDTDKK